MAEKNTEQFYANDENSPTASRDEVGFGETQMVRSDSLNDFNVYKREKRKQAIALTLVAIIGIGIVVVGFWQIKNSLTLSLPAVEEKGTALSASQAIEKIDISGEDPEVLKQRDSDGDKISDFDEYYIYGTSAYLADSDSDGDSDFDEIQNSEDPNCEKGKQCFRTGEFVEVGLSGQEESAGGADKSKNSLLNINADTLRKLLVQSGKVSEDQLKIISDEDLLAMYKQMLAENPDLVKKFEAQADVGESSEAAGEIATISDIKKALLSQGISETEINAFSDAELVQMYQEALEKVKAEK